MDVDPNISLHQQKQALNQLDNILIHCNQWIECFDQLLAVTEDVAPVRKPRQSTDHYRLNRQGKTDIDDSEQERRLEQALWRQCGRDRFMETGPWFIDGTCKYIQTYQMPLRDHLADKGWGEIDLVGVSERNLPVVFELKREDGDYLLWSMAEALGYAISVKKTWMQTEQEDRGLRTEWAAAIDECEAKGLLPKSLATVPVIIIAPEAYWDRCMGQLGKPQASEAWPSLHRLIECFDSRGYPISFVAFDTEEVEADLPRILHPRLVHLPH